MLVPVHTRAQQVPDPTQVLTPADFEIQVSKKDGDDWAFMKTDVEKQQYFNRARCECKTPIRITADLTQAGSAKGRAALARGNFELVIGGTDCVSLNTTTYDNRKCTSLRKGRLADLAAAGVQVDTDVSKLFSAPNIPNGASCAVQGPQNVWLVIDADETGYPDTNFGEGNAPQLKGLYLDGQAPPAPTKVTVTPGNEALNVEWESDALIDDKSGFVVFCSRAGLPVFEKSFYTGDEFYTRKSECEGQAQAQIQWPRAPGQAAPSPDGGATEIAAPSAFEQLDSRFVCSDLITTSNQWRIRILQNGIKYMVGVAAVDIRGNASPITTAYVQEPVPTTDFYRGYRAAGGEASGCAYGRGAAPAGLAVMALAAALGLVGWRRRRARR